MTQCFGTFSPIQRNEAVSAGAVSLLTDSTRPLFYAGIYVSRTASTGAGWTLVERQIEWHQVLPSRYLPRVALLDLDNTLVHGWSLLSWARSDHADGLTGIEDLRTDLDNAENEYLEGRITHDELLP